LPWNGVSIIANQWSPFRRNQVVNISGGYRIRQKPEDVVNILKYGTLATILEVEMILNFTYKFAKLTVAMVRQEGR